MATKNVKDFNKKWPNYSDHFKKMLQDLSRSDDNTDVTLVCDDKEQFKAHKIILSASSPLLKTLLDAHSQNDSVIYLTEVQSQEIMSILEFIYLGETKRNRNYMNDIKTVAKNLDIRQMLNPLELYDSKVMAKNQANMALIKLNEHIESVPQKQSNDLSDSITQTAEGIFTCEKCFFTTSYSWQLKRHEEVKHEGIRYGCEQCSYKATRRDHLKNHVLSQHDKILSYECDNCKQKFCDNRSLKNHILTKHEKKTYKCNLCDYQTVHTSGLSYHIKSKHEGVVYSCNECDYTVSALSHLKDHVDAKHKGITYVCSPCHFKTARKSDLYHHKKSQKHQQIFKDLKLNTD